MGSDYPMDSEKNMRNFSQLGNLLLEWEPH